MIGSTLSHIGRAAAVVGIGTLAVLGTATAANASQNAGGPLAPGQQSCTSAQYANYQVRGVGTATGQLPAGGGKFKLLRNGVVVTNTASRTNSAIFEGRTSAGTFAGPGNYQMCVNNTGAASTQVTLQLRTDAEL